MNKSFESGALVGFLVAIALALAPIGAVPNARAAELVPARQFNITIQGGTQLIDLATGKSRDVDMYYVRPSPDGKWLIGTINNGEDIQLQNVTSGRVQWMGKTNIVYFLRWEADFKSFTVYYDRRGKQPPFLYKRQRHSISAPGKARNLPEATYSDERNYSPNGLFYAASLPGNAPTMVVKATRDGKELRRFEGNFTSWTPDSKRVHFERSFGNNQRYSSWASGDSNARILGIFSDGINRFYSPDEKWLVRIEDSTLYLSRSNGTQNIKIAAAPYVGITSVTWLGDGRHILVASGHGE